MPEWAIAILKSNGLAGVFIFALLLAISAMVKMLLSKDRQLRVLHEQRAQERESLVKLMERGIEAQRMMADATERRTEMMDKFSSALVVQANANERLNDRIASQAEMFKEKLGDFKHVVDSFGEASRVLNGYVAEVRNLLISMGIKIDATLSMVVPGPSTRRRSVRKKAHDFPPHGGS